MLMPMLVMALLLLIAYFLLDYFLYQSEEKTNETAGNRLGLNGKVNLLLLLGGMAAV